MRVGIAQIRSTDDPWENFLQVTSFYAEALANKTQLLCFPENVFFRGPRTGGKHPRLDSHIPVERLNNNQVKILPKNDWAIELRNFFSEIEFPISLGSVLEEYEGESKPSNAHWVIYPGGKIVSYRKIHLFDYSSGTSQYKESDDVDRGHEIVSTQIGSWKAGLSICFDLRFPELFRNLTFHHITELLLIPAAFTLETGERHWHTLLKARAVENLSYVIAAGQWGSHKNAQGTELFCFGNSAIYGPWGELISVAPLNEDALLIADLDQDVVKKLRQSLPALNAARMNLIFSSSDGKHLKL